MTRRISHIFFQLAWISIVSFLWSDISFSKEVRDTLLKGVLFNEDNFNGTDPYIRYNFELVRVTDNGQKTEIFYFTPECTHQHGCDESRLTPFELTQTKYEYRNCRLRYHWAEDQTGINWLHSLVLLDRRLCGRRGAKNLLFAELQTNTGKESLRGLRLYGNGGGFDDDVD
ncbi:MAG: hypothetical protein AB7F43_01170 [Bacteriovoracia bacterium]